jgi:hypothetical protein
MLTQYYLRTTHHGYSDGATRVWASACDSRWLTAVADCHHHCRKQQCRHGLRGVAYLRLNTHRTNRCRSRRKHGLSGVAYLRLNTHRTNRCRS